VSSEVVRMELVAMWWRCGEVGEIGERVEGVARWDVRWVGDI
jgi:hypothetical protein